jgi:beta-xylosidase
MLRAQDKADGRLADKPLVTHIYTADAAAHVFGGRLYVYVSHDTDTHRSNDLGGAKYDMRDYHLLRLDSAAAPARDLGAVLDLGDVPWARKQLWAPDAAERDGRYYLYMPARDETGVFRIGVAVGSRPEGPFHTEPRPITGSFSIDPAVFRDGDGMYYMYFGGLRGGQLENWQEGRYDSTLTEPEADRPALGPMIARLNPDMKTFREPPLQVVINDTMGRPLLAGDHMRRFFEGAWVHKYKERYYLTYSTGNSHRLVYATSRNPYGPFTYRGVLLHPVVGWTTHASIVEFRKRWYLFYHESTLSGGKSHLRSVKMTEILYDAKGWMRVRS